MALTRAQLLMGNSAQGSILNGQVQGVTAGPGLIIDPNGSIQINSQTVIGLMKLGQTPVSAAAAYNGYTWPTTPGSIGQQLASNGSGGLSWSDPDGLAWTAKGQIVVGTGVDIQTFLNAGPNGSILIADNTQTAGLAYTSNYVPTAGATTAAFLPAGTTANRPPLTAGQAGAIRYNASSVAMELWNGTAWEEIASNAVTGFVRETSTVGSAVMPAGPDGSRDVSPAAGYTRFNTTSASLEVWNGVAWTLVGAPPTGGLGINVTGGIVKVAISSSSSPPPVGGSANQAVVGSLFWNDVLAQLFIYYSNGGTPVWVQAAPSATSGGGGSTYTGTAPIVVTGTDISVSLGLGVAANGTNLAFQMPVAATPPAINTTSTGAFNGSMYWDNNLGQLFIRYANGASPTWVAAAPPAGGGGGGGTVTGVTASLPLVSSGGAAPNLTINAATTAAAGSAQLAASTDSAAGTSATLVSTPAFTVPKDAAGMTGAALIPTGTNAQRASIASPANGFLRYNTDNKLFEAYVSAVSSWFQIPFINQIPTQPDYTVTNGQVLGGVIYCNNFTVPAGVTCTVAGSIYVFAQGNVTIAGTVSGLGLGPRGAQSYGTTNPSAGNLYAGLGTGPSPGNGNAGGPAVSPAVSLLGSGGGGGFVGAGPGTIYSLSTPEGGNAGASLLFRALGSIAMSGNINCSGAGSNTPGSPDGNLPISGGGGGSGGVIILDANGNSTNTGTIVANGGYGGFGVNIGANGGGGGGGGTVIIQSRYGVETLGTVSVIGGPRGSDAAGGIGIGGGGGGGCGGAGGNTQLDGGTGITLTFGSPLPA